MEDGVVEDYMSLIDSGYRWMRGRKMSTTSVHHWFIVVVIKGGGKIKEES